MYPFFLYTLDGKNSYIELLKYVCVCMRVDTLV